MLAVARTLPPVGASIARREGDAWHLDLWGEAFDLLPCQQGLQFFSHRAAAAGEIRRVLRNDGRSSGCGKRSGAIRCSRRRL
jgi:ubiquinone/menaquinone biosynthesis C-methylase UbiE